MFVGRFWLTMNRIFWRRGICENNVINDRIAAIYKRKNLWRSKEMYEPKPIDTSDVKLSDELLLLTEKIAENVHDVYVRSRIDEGWTYGEYRDDVKKTNPTLVPYGELPESEKEYDRNTALETLKLIVTLGYEIRKA